MPISRKEFETGELDLSFLIIDFLRTNSDDAYNVEELVAELALKGMSLTVEKVQTILSSLESRGRVQTQTRDGVVYYIYSRRIGFRPS